MPPVRSTVIGPLTLLLQNRIFLQRQRPRRSIGAKSELERVFAWHGTRRRAAAATSRASSTTAASTTAAPAAGRRRDFHPAVPGIAYNPRLGGYLQRARVPIGAGDFESRIA